MNLDKFILVERDNDSFMKFIKEYDNFYSGFDNNYTLDFNIRYIMIKYNNRFYIAKDDIKNITEVLLDEFLNKRNSLAGIDIIIPIEYMDKKILRFFKLTLLKWI